MGLRKEGVLMGATDNFGWNAVSSLGKHNDEECPICKEFKEDSHLNDKEEEVKCPGAD